MLCRCAESSQYSSAHTCSGVCMLCSVTVVATDTRPRLVTLAGERKGRGICYHLVKDICLFLREDYNGFVRMKTIDCVVHCLAYGEVVLMSRSLMISLKSLLWKWQLCVGVVRNHPFRLLTLFVFLHYVFIFVMTGKQTSRDVTTLFARSFAESSLMTASFTFWPLCWQTPAKSKILFNQLEAFSVCVCILWISGAAHHQLSEWWIEVSEENKRFRSMQVKADYPGTEKNITQTLPLFLSDTLPSAVA